MNSTKNIINLYSNGYVKGEIRSRKYENRLKQEKALNSKLDLADMLFNELSFSFKQYQKNHVRELIRLFRNFKELHSRASNEEIILAFILYVKSLETGNTFINTNEAEKTIRQIITDIDKQISFHNTFEIIQWKITLHYITNTPILPTEPEHIDHNLLYKGTIK